VATNVVAFGRVRKNLKMGCVGLPNVGKSSLFNLLTEQNAAAENYPFCTIEPNEARCAVPDVRYVSLLFICFSSIELESVLFREGKKGGRYRVLFVDSKGSGSWAISHGGLELGWIFTSDIYTVISFSRSYPSLY
jgi:hypothetical protein